MYILEYDYRDRSIEIVNYNLGYDLYYHTDIIYFSNCISKELSMTRYEYHDILKAKYHGCLLKNKQYPSAIGFNDKQDAEKALEWIESILLINKLKKKVIKCT